MRRYIKPGILLCLIFTLNISAQTGVSSKETLQDLASLSGIIQSPAGPNDAPENDPDIMTYTFYPVDTSQPAIDNLGDGIGGRDFSPEEAWFAFDLSGIAKNAQVLSATLSIYLRDDDGIPTQRTLWYDATDTWIDVNQPELSDPGDYVEPDQLVGTIEHDEQSYTLKTIVITYDGWANDIADGYISLMLTGPVSGFEDGSAALTLDKSQGVQRFPELALTVLEEPQSKVYTNLFDLKSEETATINGYDIDVGTYSVPSCADWNNDGLTDLIVGTGSGYVRVYLNVGTDSEPQFSNITSKSFYAKSGSSDLQCPPSGCMGCFPRVVDWNDDGKKDLLVGQSNGQIRIFLNTNTDDDPIFDEGTLFGYDRGFYVETVDIGSRATPSFVDWNNDGLKDVVCGALDGKIRIFLNEGTNAEPAFYTYSYVNDVNQVSLSIPSGRSSPVIVDLDFDGKKDILAGNTDGQLLLYLNQGTDEDPVFAGYELVDANGIIIDLEGTPRSRPSVCYWDSDGYPDVLIGAYDGKIHVYRCERVPADLDFDGDIDFTDFALFAAFWHKTDAEGCGGADLNNDGKVDIEDATWIAANWLLNIK